MATVRTAAPRGSEPANKRKRKRLSKSKSSSAPASPSGVDAQLQTLENWHRALTVDVRELRREGARVRLELEKVDDTAEAAVEKAESCAAQAKAATQARDAAQQREDKLSKKLAAMDKKLEKLRRCSINEELLMTQLMGLQEQYETELAKVKDAHDAALQNQQTQLDAVLAKIQEDATHKKQLEKTLQSLKNENTRLSHKLTQTVTRQDVAGLQDQLQTLERDGQEEDGRTRADLNAFEDKLAEVDRRFVDVDRNLADVNARAAAQAPLAPLPPPPLPLPRDLVRHGDLSVIHDELRRVNRDLRTAAVDFASLTKRMDDHRGQQEQYVESRLQELSKQLFDALSHDSRLHVNEISRLKDAVFDLQSDHREFGQRMRRLEDDVQKVTTARAPPRSPPRDRAGPAWRHGQDQPPILPTPPVHRNHRERPSRYEPPPPAQDQIRWVPRRRSRSRSPPRRPSWGAAGSSSSRSDSGLTSAQSDRRHQREGQGYNPDRSNGGDAASARNNVTELSDSSPSLPVGNAHGNVREVDEGQANMPFRRSRQPRRTPEVIVIEEDDDDDDDEEEEENAEQGDRVAEGGENGDEAEDAAPSRAPPDVVLDEEEASQEADVTMVAPPDSSNTDPVESADHLEKEADLRTGFLLYFCLGGAPDLGAQWTNCFSQLRADECVEMPRVLSFQRRYGILQNFPVYLTQCILQAVILNGQNVPEGNDSVASRPTGALSVSSLHATFDEVVKAIHLSWAEALIEHLSKLANTIDDLASQKLQLSINPAALSSSADKDEIIYEWSRRQESVMWILARKLHYGSFVPSMKCNVDASPAVYLFTTMFDVRTVTSVCPQFGTFRLNAFGAKLMAYLWDQTLKKLPYVFFADWSWLDDQSTKQKLPALGFCHLLASILLWNSAIDHHSLTNRSVYAAAVKHLLPKLAVGGQRVHGSEAAEASFLLLGECESTRIELWDLDSKFASILGLDGFFEVMEAIQNNMLAVAGARSS
ncbi:hypothetical protein PRNP1_007713 [Phytophthora ramorum]